MRVDKDVGEFVYLVFLFIVRNNCLGSRIFKIYFVGVCLFEIKLDGRFSFE